MFCARKPSPNTQRKAITHHEGQARGQTHLLWPPWSQPRRDAVCFRAKAERQRGNHAWRFALLSTFRTFSSSRKWSAARERERKNVSGRMWQACTRWPRAEDFKSERAQVSPPLMQPAATQSDSSSQQVKRKNEWLQVRPSPEKTSQAPETKKKAAAEAASLWQIIGSKNRQKKSQWLTHKWLFPRARIQEIFSPPLSGSVSSAFSFQWRGSRTNVKR